MEIITEREMSKQTMISVKGVKKAFGNVQALRGVDFELQSGKVLGLLGPNGAGKTTLIRIMTTLLKPDQGEVSVAGFDVLRNPQAVRSVIGLAGQYTTVDGELTGLENLHMVGHLSHLDSATVSYRASSLVERFSLTQAANRVVKTYSGGMRRRLDVAASLLIEPPVLFLDEPTTGLDLHSRTEMWNIVRKLVADGTTVLLTTQYLEEADQLADTICILNNGEIVARGTPEELKVQSGGGVLRITVAEITQLEQASQLIASLGARNPQIDAILGQISLPVTNGTRTLVEAIRILDEKNIQIADIALHHPTLDDVFLALTGHKMSADGSAPNQRSRIVKQLGNIWRKS